MNLEMSLDPFGKGKKAEKVAIIDSNGTAPPLAAVEKYGEISKYYFTELDTQLMAGLNITNFQRKEIAKYEIYKMDPDQIRKFFAEINNPKYDYKILQGNESLKGIYTSLLIQKSFNSGYNIFILENISEHMNFICDQVFGTPKIDLKIKIFVNG